MAEPYAIAVIGVGKIARDQHLPAIAKDQRFQLVATVNPRGGGIDGTPNFDTLQAMLAAGVRVDAVSICTPPQVREAIARDAIKAQLATLLEKPPTATLAAFEGLSARARKAGVVLFATWHLRFAPMIEEARHWLANRRVTGGKVTWHENAHKWHPGQNWLFQAGGLGVFDPGINALSVITAILPEPPVVTVAQFQVPRGAATPIAVEMSLRTGDADLAVSFDFRADDVETWNIEITTEDGHTLHLLDGATGMAIDGEPVRRLPEAEYQGVYARFAKLLQTRDSDADPAPLRLVADAFMLADMQPTDPYSP